MKTEKDSFDMSEMIDAYLQGELTAEEQKSFESKIGTDPELEEEIRVNRAINFAVEHQDKKALKDELVKTDNLIKDVRKRVQLNYESAENVAEENFLDQMVASFNKFLLMIFPPNPVVRLAMVAALFAILMVPTYVLFFQSSSTGQLYADNFTPYQNVITTASRSDVEQTGELDKIMGLYESRNYKGAINGFNSYLHENPDHYEVKLYRGISNLQLDSINRAIEDLEAVINNNRKLVDQAKWYLALTYLKNENVEEASKVLKEIVENQSVFSDKAQKVLNQVK